VSLAAILAAELDRPVPAGVQALAAHLAGRAPETVAAILFYGSALRTGRADELIDLYVIVDSLRAWHGGRAPALANRWLPPSIEFVEHAAGGAVLRAKVAVLDRAQFRARCRPGTADGTIWARFAQPVALVHGRDAAARAEIAAAVADAVTTAAGWAARLGPPSGAPQDYWQALFAATYAAELRVETAARAVTILDHAPARYAELLRPAWEAGGIAFEDQGDGRLAPRLDDADRRRALRRWAWRRRAGKALNLARLAKAAVTVRGGARYIAWKVERHTGLRVEPTPWQERHPLLAGLALLWKLRRRGVVR